VEEGRTAVKSNLYGGCSSVGSSARLWFWMSWVQIPPAAPNQEQVSHDHHFAARAARGSQAPLLSPSKGLSTVELVREALDRILAEVPQSGTGKGPTRSLYGLLAKYGAAPSAEEIDQNRAKILTNFPSAHFG
jgi:hypothetical protein